MKKLVAVFSVVCLLFVGTANSRGSIVVHAVETGGNVEFSGGGTADLTGLVQNGLVVMAPFVSPDVATFSVGGMTSSEIDGYNTLAGPTTFGSGGATFADNTSGDRFGIVVGSVLIVPNNYVSNSAIFGTSTYTGATFNSLGMTPGTYVWTWGQGESFTLHVGNVVPEPTTAIVWMTLAGAGLMVCRRRR